MLLFVDTISVPQVLILLDEDLSIVARENTDVRFAEFERLPEKIEHFVTSHTRWSSVRGIVCAV